MKTLYLLAESDTDALFYAGCAERVIGEAFIPVCYPMRKGGGIRAVRESLTLLLKQASRMQEGSGFHLLLAMDNDRSPHANAVDALSLEQRKKLPNADAHKRDRYLEILDELEEKFGRDRSRWRVPVAVAVPVEMIENWLLLIARGGKGSELPRFARQNSPPACHFHHPSKPPPQLKDRCETACAEDGMTNDTEWLLHLVTEKLNPEDLAQRSPSFALFKQWLDAWPRTYKPV